MSRRWVATAAVLTALVVGACSGTGMTPSTPTPAFDPLQDPERIPVLLRKEIGEDVTVRRISMTEYGFSAEVRDPKRPQNLDDYRFYNGQWDTEPVSVSQYEIDRLDRTTFRLGAVDWSVIPELQRKALAGLDFEQEQVSVVSIDRLEGEGPRIFLAVQGDRGTGTLIADARGRDVEVRRN